MMNAIARATTVPFLSPIALERKIKKLQDEVNR